MTRRITRRRARETGKLFYYTGKPCRHGHDSQRYVSSSRCVECRRSARDNDTERKKRLDGYYRRRQADWIGIALTNAKTRSKLRGLEYTITREDVVVPTHCPVFGTLLQTGNEGFMPNSPSLDRIYPTKGYVPGNVVVISNKANILKKDGTLDDFRQLVAWLETLPEDSPDDQD